MKMSVDLESTNQQFNDSDSVCNILKSLAEEAGENKDLNPQIRTYDKANDDISFTVVEEQTGIEVLNSSLDESLIMIETNDENNENSKNEEKDDEDNKDNDVLNRTSESMDCEIISVVTRKNVKKSASYDTSKIIPTTSDDSTVNLNSVNHTNVISTKSNSLASLLHVPLMASTPLSIKPLIETTEVPSTTIIIKPDMPANVYRPPETISQILSSKMEYNKYNYINLPNLPSPPIPPPSYLNPTPINYSTNGFGNFTVPLHYKSQAVNKLFIDNFGRLQRKPMMAQEILKTIALKKQNVMQKYNRLDFPHLRHENVNSNVVSSGSSNFTGDGSIAANEVAEKMRPAASVAFYVGLDFVRLYAFEDQFNYFSNYYQGKEDVDDHSVKEKIGKLKENCQAIRQSLIPYNIPYVKCGCRFKTFLNCSLHSHKRSGHSSGGGSIGCCLCMKYATKSRSKMLEHMLAEHKVQGNLTQPMASFPCDYCSYEGREYKKLLSHMKQCQKWFDYHKNQMTFINPFELSMVKQVAVQNVSQPSVHNLNLMNPLLNFGNGPSAVGNNVLATKNSMFVSNFGQPGSFSNVNPYNDSQTPLLTLAQIQDLIKRKKINVASLNPFTTTTNPVNLTPQMAKIELSKKILNSQMINNRSTSSLNVLTSKKSNLINPKQKPIIKVVKSLKSNNKINNHIVNIMPKIDQTTSNKYISEMINSSKPTNEMVKNVTGPSCEVCNERVNNLESLLLHMNVIHKMKIYDTNFFLKGKNFVCKSCFECFWTRLGLEMHEHLIHNDELKFCMLCHAPKSNILGHLMTTHNKTLQDMLILKYCYICNSALTNFDDFSIHMCINHKDIFPSFNFLQEMIRTSDNGASAKSVKFDLFQKISSKKPTMTTTTTTTPTTTTAKYSRFKCNPCDTKFTTGYELQKHIKAKHTIACNRCKEKFPNQTWANTHFTNVHAKERDPCQLCGEMVKIGIPMVRHVRRVHLRRCSVIITRLPIDSKPKPKQKVKKSLLKSNSKICIVPLINLADDDTNGVKDGDDVMECD